MAVYNRWTGLLDSRFNLENWAVNIDHAINTYTAHSRVSFYMVKDRSAKKKIIMNNVGIKEEVPHLSPRVQ